MVVERELLICSGTYLRDEETATTSHFCIGVTIVGTSLQTQKSAESADYTSYTVNNL